MRRQVKVGGHPGYQFSELRPSSMRCGAQKGRGTDISLARRPLGKLQAHYQLARSSKPAPWIEQLKAAHTVLTHPT